MIPPDDSRIPAPEPAPLHSITSPPVATTPVATNPALAPSTVIQPSILSSTVRENTTPLDTVPTTMAPTTPMATTPTNPEPSNPSNPDPSPNVPTPAPITPPSKPEPPPVPAAPSCPRRPKELPPPTRRSERIAARQELRRSTRILAQTNVTEGPKLGILDDAIREPLTEFWSALVGDWIPPFARIDKAAFLATALDEVYSGDTNKVVQGYALAAQAEHEPHIPKTANKAPVDDKKGPHKGPVRKKYKKKSKYDPTTFTYWEARRSKMWPAFQEALHKEITQLEDHGTWIEVPREQAFQLKKKVVPSTVVFKLRMNPDGAITKVKARFCLRGDLQEDVGDTYAPVASWATVRSVLLISQCTNRVTCTIDFSNAFVQSPMPEGETVFMEMPPGYTSSKHADGVLLLKKTIYGGRQNGRAWVDYSQAKMKDYGLKQSEHDPCL